MVKWHARLSNGALYEGATDDGSWQDLSEKLSQCDNTKIENLELSNQHGGARIDPNCDGYYVGNKVIASFPDAFNKDLVGIGYWKKTEPMVRIKWYDKSTMELLSTEAKHIRDCNPKFLILNYRVQLA